MAKPKVQLPVLPSSSLKEDGSRNFVHPADVKGRFVKARYAFFAVLIVVWAIAPWVKINGNPALFLDVVNRRFYLFGLTFNAQDAWLLFFVFSGIGLSIIFITTILGRVWCGWACPQTVFMEGVFRRIERYVEGPRNTRLKRNAGPWTFDKVWRKVLKHVLFVVAALFVSHVLLSFFTSMPTLLSMMGDSPAEHPAAFGWMLGVSVVLYGNFAWFREQLCMIICPYGRMQSVMTDDDSLVVGYDAIRGEPRGKAKDPNAGDCVDCKRCVVVCPTGIDIRNGLQLDCIGCTACIDACDEVMDKLGRDRGLVRYDSLNGLEHRPTRIFRPRLLGYAVILAAWAVGAYFAFSSNDPFEANLVRLRGAPYHLIEEGTVARNLYTLHLINKSSDEATFTIEPVETEGQHYRIGHEEVTLGSLDGQEIPVYVDVAVETFSPGDRLRLRVTRTGDDPEEQIVDAALLGPRR